MRANEAGAIISLALSAYRNDHGHYPKTLDALVPDYLSTMPLDPFSDEPLRYRLVADNRFLLYSVNENGTDDGAICRDENGQLIPRNERPDWLLPEPRQEADDEWILIDLPEGITVDDLKKTPREEES